MKKLGELSENPEWQFSELRGKMNEQNEYFTKEIETLIKNQTEIVELRNSLNETKNSLESIGNRADHTEERYSDLKIEI